MLKGAAGVAKGDGRPDSIACFQGCLVRFRASFGKLAYGRYEVFRRDDDETNPCKKRMDHDGDEGSCEGLMQTGRVASFLRSCRI